MRVGDRSQPFKGDDHESRSYNLPFGGGYTINDGLPHLSQ
jgi:hypothetical protein